MTPVYHHPLPLHSIATYSVLLSLFRSFDCPLHTHSLTHSPTHVLSRLCMRACKSTQTHIDSGVYILIIILLPQSPIFVKQ